MSDADTRIAVVTGASSGIGRAIAIELGQAGFDVFAHAASSRDEIQETVRVIRDGGRDVACELCDFLHDDLRSLVDEAFAWKGRVDVWVNNAGADVLTGSATDWDFERKLSTLLKVDVAGTLLLSRLAGNRMNQLFDGSPDGPTGVLINMGWDQAWQGMAGDSGEMFAAAKGAVMSASLSLAQSLAPTVRVNCVAPGWVKTAWGEQASEYWEQRARNSSLLRRWATPDDVARTVRFLASDDAAFINGQVIPVNGGYDYFGGPQP